jgi:type I restriction enzyme M protein
MLSMYSTELPISDFYTDFYDKAPWKRFEYGTPSKSLADWGWVQHILASLNDQGRAGVVLDTQAVSRGSSVCCNYSM